jgi:hypothetical protein
MMMAFGTRQEKLRAKAILRYLPHAYPAIHPEFTFIATFPGICFNEP